LPTRRTDCPGTSPASGPAARGPSALSSATTANPLALLANTTSATSPTRSSSPSCLSGVLLAVTSAAVCHRPRCRRRSVHAGVNPAGGPSPPDPRAGPRRQRPAPWTSAASGLGGDLQVDVL